MKHLDEFRDAALAKQLLEGIRRTTTRPHVLMEVCGGQTHSLLRHGIATELRDVVELIHGPGCPVCVTPMEAIDFAQNLAMQEDVLLTSFGDMLRVPGSSRSLLDSRGEGGNVRVVYSPLDAVELAKTNPDRQIVFLAVGFETTAPATALAILQAAELGLKNFSMLVAHVRVLPAMEAIMQSENCRVEGFLAAGHVCTVTGFEEYDEFVRQYRVPVVVTGFEPVDLLGGIHECVEMLESGRCEVINRYARSVQRDGNESAQDVVAEVYEIADTPWRGLGIIPAGGFRLRPKYVSFDATIRFSAIGCAATQCASQECRSGEVLSGRIKPIDCAAFGTKCTPDTPLGAPMVSSEGACAAYFKYQHATV